ncbi:hypothetical protein J6590_023211 [Homalodisca vitripennis]|nr:hypothetical protein J6590_023211 [Homalodisca vitripennis]
MAIQLIFRYPIPDQLGSRSDGHGLHRKVAHCGLYLTLQLKGLVTSVYLVPLEEGGSLWPVSYVTAQGAGHLCVSCTSGGMAIQLIFRYPIPDQLGSRSYGHGLHRKVAHCGLYLTLKLKGLVTSVYLVPLEYGYTTDLPLGSRSDGHGLHRKVAHCGLYLTLKLKGLVTSVYLVPLEYGYTTDLPVTYPRSAG